MPVNKFRFYMGPLGNVQALPPLPKGSNPEASGPLIGAVHQALSGRTTYDLFAVRRNWTFGWKFLKESDLVMLVASYRRMNLPLGGSLRLMDMRKKNLLSPQISSGGSEHQSALGFTASNGTTVWAQASGLPPNLAPYLLGGQSWSGMSTGGTLTTSTTEMPAIPGSTYLFSAYGGGSGSYQPVVTPYDVTGTAGTPVTGTTVAMSAGWSTAPNGVLQYLVPSSGVASLSVGWKCTATGTLNTTGWQAEIDSGSGMPAVWGVGAGCPRVYVSAMSEVYPYLGFYQSTVVLQEV